MSSTLSDWGDFPEVRDSQIFCRMHPRGHSDAAKRMADNVNMHYAANELGAWDAVGKWIAYKLEDGSSDQVAYDTMADAVRHTDEMTHQYVRLNGMRMDYCEAQALMEVHRRARLAGFPQADPNHRSGGKQMLLSNRIEVREQVLSILRTARSGN